MEFEIYNLDIERSILGSIFIDPAIISHVSENIDGDDFYDKNHKLIYQAMLNTIRGVNVTINPVVIIDNLKSKNKLDEIGGEGYIYDLFENAVTSADIDFYLDRLKYYSKKRSMYTISQKIHTDIIENKKDIEEILEETQVSISSIYNSNEKDGIMLIADLITQKKKNIENNHSYMDRFLPTGYYQYDDISHGLKPGALIILAARPAVGKTALALNMALNVAKKNKRVLFFSLEMGHEELLNRLIASEGQLELEKVINGSYVKNSEDLNKYNMALNELENLYFHIDARATLTLENIKNTARNLKRESGLDFVVIDYLTLITSNSKNSSREQVVAEISRGLKVLAKELDIPILTLAQLSRNVEKREEKRPMLSDLRESGSIEQDADQVMFLFNAEYHKVKKNDISSSNDKMTSIELILSKNRHGQTGTMLLYFKKEWQKFVNPSKEEISLYFANMRDEE